jgi:hypothetical protein
MGGKMKHGNWREWSALFVAGIALFVALGGSVYAAKKRHKISGRAIKVKSLPGNRLKLRSVPGNRLKPHSIPASGLQPGCSRQPLTPQPH